MDKVEVYFMKMLDAKKALDALKNAGFKNVYLDAADSFAQEYSKEINFADPDTDTSLSALVLMSGTRIDDIGKAPLTAASPTVSGFGSFEHVSENLKARLIINVDKSRVEDVKQILREHHLYR